MMYTDLGMDDVTDDTATIHNNMKYAKSITINTGKVTAK